VDRYSTDSLLCCKYRITLTKIDLKAVADTFFSDFVSSRCGTVCTDEVLALGVFTLRVTPSSGSNLPNSVKHLETSARDVRYTW
jgi:hypothetical protein